MVKNFKLLIIAIGSFVYVKGQDSTKTAPPPPPPAPPAVDSVSPKPTFTGSVDLYYRYNFAGSKTSFNNPTSFTNSQNSFELGMADIKYDHSWGKAGATVELGFGRRAQEFSYNDGVTNPYFSLANVVQAYVYYNISDKIKLTMGKWATHIGYELVDAYQNRNYSMSYMFSYGPFFNTGLKADVSLGGKSAFMVGISNATDHSTTNTSQKSAIAQFSTGTANGKWKFYLNYQGGKYDFNSVLNQFDVVITGTITDKFNVGYNGTLQTRKTDSTSSQNWWGQAIYLNADPSAVFGLTLRAEYFSDKDNLLHITANGGTFTEFTLSGNIRHNKLTIIPEIRFDNSSDNAFQKSDGTPTGSTFTGILAATYTF
jgi:hypothetical protein